MNALLNVLVLTLGTALGASAPTVGPPAPMMAMGAAVPVYQVAAVQQARGGDLPGPSEQSTCTATCTEGPNQQCSGTSCHAVNQNCSTGVQGYAECDGTYHYCAACPGGGCTFFECRHACYCPGGFSYCVDISTCECDCIYQ